MTSSWPSSLPASPLLTQATAGTTAGFYNLRQNEHAVTSLKPPLMVAFVKGNSVLNCFDQSDA
ncbi:MAG: hypothetical protein K2Z81_24450 [Cyanobacteria bacterium]|nr:hypothetical protein [Cyanobacteriota bacterium]